MKRLSCSEYVTKEIDDEGTQRFEAFLDRNFPKWREREDMHEENAGTVVREWMVGVDDIERSVYYRKQYVELFDSYIGLDDSRKAIVHFTKHIICDIDQDLTPVAVWAE